ncbi:Glucan endo-1,3-alpha-glucosidase agn1 [Paraconiothyrium brasiliense]|uniref:Glucan endo-1,3-alpha-glucosidase agn1 n=1 Tax=Paraconiothyrium brasiliense TaxID=300254 RepID=A0ABR3S2D5_9PLEO
MVQTNEAWTWFNDCSVGGSQDDENPVKDPDLPVPPSSGGGGGSPGNGGGGSAPPPPTVGGVYYDLPHFPTFVSLGDSYAAGIGSGSQAENKWDAQADYQCFTTVNAYGHSFWTTNLGDKSFDFLACTGDKIENVLTEGSHGRPSQISILKDQIGGSQLGMATLSIGGNDAMFAEVAIRCLFFGMNSCDQYMADAELAVVDMRPKLVSTYRAILDAVDYQYFTLIVTGYASFFNDEDQSGFGAADENCDKQTISVVEEDNVLNKHVPYLTRSIRTELNRAVQAMNKQIQLAVGEVQALYPFKRVKFVDMEPLFDGHRFCDKGDDGKLLDLEDVYFFVPYADDITETGHELNPRDSDGTKVDLTKRDAAGSECESWTGYFADLWDCAWAQAVAQTGSDDPVDVKVNGEKYPDIAGRSLSFITKNGLYKAMHPKSIVHQKLAKLIMSEWKVWGVAD